ncbi:MAG: citrate synthase, partial [Raoultibacter sp.]
MEKQLTQEERKIALYDQFNDINAIDPSFYEQYDVKRGLRNSDGTGVVAGVTNISNVHGYVLSDGDKKPDEGILSFRGYNVSDLLAAAPF